MKMLDLFSGIGGFALSAQWRWGEDLDIVGFCEIEKYAQKVLKKNFPGVSIYDDITKLDGKLFKNIDLITGGFPCQDISIAGKGAGIEGKRSGLWSEMHRIISEVRPRYAIIENVPMLTIRGGTRVIADLAEIGYDCEWQVIGADEVGAWHRRKRIWIVAYPKRLGWDERSDIQGVDSEQETSSQPTECSETQSYAKNVSNTNNSRHMDRQTQEQSAEGRLNALCESEPSSTNERNVSDTNIGDAQTGRERSGGVRKESSKERSSSDASSSSETISNSNIKRSQGLVERPQKSRRSNEPTRFRSRARQGGWWNSEPNVGRVANGIPNRVDRLRGLGNAIVPQVAYEIMKKIEIYNE